MTAKEANYISRILKAYAEGKEIQYKIDDDTWGYIDPTETRNDILYYISKGIAVRVKPKNVLKPYDNSDDFILGLKQNGGYVIIDNLVCNPVNINNAGITVIKDGIIVSYSYEELLAENIEWADGNQIGRVVDEEAFDDLDY